jgi:Flp pilus assembly protein TadG
MRSRAASTRRRGTTVLECAFVLPIALIIILALIIGGMGVFRYQEVATLAREGARWAAVHGSQYEKERRQAGDMTSRAATPDDVLQQAILPRATALDPARLTCTVVWPDGDKWPQHVISDTGQARSNRVKVTVTYQWVPEAIFGGVALQSTSEVLMCY